MRERLDDETRRERREERERRERGERERRERSDIPKNAMTKVGKGAGRGMYCCHRVFPKPHTNGHKMRVSVVTLLFSYTL